MFGNAEKPLNDLENVIYKGLVSLQNGFTRRCRVQIESTHGTAVRATKTKISLKTNPVEFRSVKMGNIRALSNGRYVFSMLIKRKNLKEVK